MLDDLIPAASVPVPGESSRLWEGTILDDALAATDLIRVALPGADNEQHALGPCPFMPRGTALPQQGARCLVAIDDDGSPWIVAWDGPIGGSAGGLNDAGIVVHGSDPNVARPGGYAAVIWVGSVDPVNSSDTLDVWIDTTDFGAAYQPLNAQLTAIAALSTTSVGRALLTIADSAAGRTALVAHKLIPVVTSLPGSPADADEVYYEFTESAVPTSTRKHRWHLMWSSTLSKWMVLSATPIYALVDTLETRAVTTYGDLSGGATGPSVTVPLAGDYDVTIEASIANNTASDGGRMSYDVGATGALDADGILHFGNPANADTQPSGTRRKTGLAASTAMVAKYKALVGGTASFRFRRIIVRPVLIG